MADKMETLAERVLTDLQRDPVRIAVLKEKVKRIGVKWVALATGYNDQTITNYITVKRGVERLENAIIANLATALSLKLEQQKREADAAWLTLHENMDQLRKENFSDAAVSPEVATKKPSANPQTAFD